MFTRCIRRNPPPRGFMPLRTSGNRSPSTKRTAGARRIFGSAIRSPWRQCIVACGSVPDAGQVRRREWQLDMLYRAADEYLLYSPKFDLYSLLIRFPDPDFLEKYFGLVYGPIAWNK